MASHELAKINLKDVEQAGYTTAVFPIGATEPHNFHLPYGVDNIIAEHVARGAVEWANARGGRCVCLPPLQFGYEGNMRGFPLAINLQPTTLIRIVEDISHTLVESGIDFLFILNGHGGNELKTIIRELNREIDLFISGANWWDSVWDVVRRETPGDGDHANEMETAAVMHLAPELVKMAQAEDGRMSRPSISEMEEGWVKYSRHWKAYTPSSGAGDPRRATAEAGKRLMDAAVAKIGGYLQKLSTSHRHKAFPFAEE